MAGAIAGGQVYQAITTASKAAERAVKSSGALGDSYQLVYAPPNKLTVAEAFVLLWQDPETGDISGRRADTAVQSIAVTAMMLDLVLMGKLTLEFTNKKGIFGTKEQALVCTGDVSDPLPPAAAFLQSLLDKFVEYNKGHEPRSLQSWMEKLMMSFREKSPRVYIDEITDSLISKGIVHKESKWNGLRFPTDDPSAEKAAVDGLRNVILNGAEPDVMSATLFMLARAADSNSISRPFMYSVLSKEEYKANEQRIKQLEQQLK